jgi:hypothetical protein
MRRLAAGGRQAKVGGCLLLFLRRCGPGSFSGGLAAATGREYQYCLTEMVLAFTMSGPK